ncbi:MAG: RadC family protein [Marinifilaceae bacterium]
MDRINYNKITNMEMDARPRERMKSHGASVLSLSELLAVLLRSGNGDESALQLGQRIVADCGGDLDKLSQLSLDTLMHNYKGIGLAKAASIVAALEFSRRRVGSGVSESTRLYNSQAVYNYVAPHLLDLDHEEFWVVYLNRGLRAIDKRRIGLGGVSSTPADITIIYSNAVQLKASGIIAVHNHPSGHLEPSAEDKHLTTRIKEAGKIMGIPLQDHLIVGAREYYSFVDNGIL